MNVWRKQRDPSRTLHPLWRGVGCFLVILIPVAAWWLSGLAMEYLQVWLPEFARIVRRGGEQIIYIQIGLAIVLGLVLYMLLSFLSALLYTLVDQTDRLFSRSKPRDEQ
ncbi:MAG: hypothetical protein KIS80_10180 [Anaerolineales bacterium]|nr:hypothetical protein [Anaerolineales bacterium]